MDGEGEEGHSALDCASFEFNKCSIAIEKWYSNGVVNLWRCVRTDLARRGTRHPKFLAELTLFASRDAAPQARVPDSLGKMRLNIVAHGDRNRLVSKARCLMPRHRCRSPLSTAISSISSL